MATTWSAVISTAMQIIDDERWQEQLAVNPAQFLRAKGETLLYALPLLNRPPELLTYLQGGLTLPSYDNGEWVSTEASTTGETTVNTGMTGYDLMSCVVRSPDGTGWTAYTAASYDPETGTITFPQQTEAGIVYEYDLYTDGTLPDLTYTQTRLFGLAIAVVWDEHFERNFLDLTMKIHDSSFSTVNEANYMEKSNRRLRDNRQSFNDELRMYEQSCAYASLMERVAGQVKLT